MAEDTEAKHSGNNGKKEGLSGSSVFTWFMVIALLGVWTSVAVVWFELVDYEDVLGKLDAYDTDGDGDFDIDDAKVLLGLKDRVLAKQESEDPETDSQATSEYLSDLDLEDFVNDEPESDLPYEDINDLEEALDDHDAPQAEDDTVSDFNLEDAVEPSVHKSLNAEPEAEDEPEEAELVTEEQAEIEEEYESEEQVFVEDLGQETFAAFEKKVEDLPHTHEDDPEAEQEPDVEEEEAEAEPVVEESEGEVETPESEADEEPVLEEELAEEEVVPELFAAEKVDEIPEPVEEELSENEEAEVAVEAEPEPQDENEESEDEAEVADNQRHEPQEETEEVEAVEEPVLEEVLIEEPVMEAEVREEQAEEDVMHDEEDEPTWTQEDESAEFLAEGEAVPEQIEVAATDTLEETLYEEQQVKEEQNTETAEDPHEDHADT